MPSSGTIQPARGSLATPKKTPSSVGQHYKVVKQPNHTHLSGKQLLVRQEGGVAATNVPGLSSIDAQRNSLHDKLQQLHGYITRLGELTSTNSTSSLSTSTSKLVTSPGKLPDVSFEGFDALSDDVSTKPHHPAHSQSVGGQALSGSTAGDIAAIEEWLHSIRQHHAAGKALPQTSAQNLSHVAKLVRSSTLTSSDPSLTFTPLTRIIAPSSARKPSRQQQVRVGGVGGKLSATTGHVAALTKHYATLPLKSNDFSKRLQLITSSDATSGLHSSVPVKDYSPANTAFVNGKWIATRMSAGSVQSTVVVEDDDASVDELDSIEDFDSKTALRPTSTTSHSSSASNRQKHSKSTHLISPVNSQTADGGVGGHSSTNNSSPMSADPRIDADFADLDDSGLLEEKVAGHAAAASARSGAGTGNGVKGAYTVPKNTLFVNGRWISTAAPGTTDTSEHDDIDDLSDIEGDGVDDTRKHHRTLHSQTLSPQSRSSVRSDIDSLDDSELEAVHAHAQALPSITLIRPDQYSGKALPAVDDSMDGEVGGVGTELDGLSDFDDNDTASQAHHMAALSDAEGEGADSADELRSELDDFLDDDEHDTDSISITDAQRQMMQTGGSGQVEDKAKAELQEFEISVEAVAAYQEQASQRMAWLSVLTTPIAPFSNATKPNPFSSLSLLLPSSRLTALADVYAARSKSSNPSPAKLGSLPVADTVDRPDDLDDLDDL